MENNNGQQLPINTKKLFAEINNLQSLEEILNNDSLTETLQRISYICNTSAQHILEQGENVFEKNTVKRNTKYLGELGKLANEISEQYGSIMKQSRALFEETKMFLDRYYTNGQEQSNNGQQNMNQDINNSNMNESKLHIYFKNHPSNEVLTIMENYLSTNKLLLEVNTTGHRNMMYDSKSRCAMFSIKKNDSKRMQELVSLFRNKFPNEIEDVDIK